MDLSTRQKVDAYRDLIRKDKHTSAEDGFGITIVYMDGKTTYTPFCVAPNPLQMNRFEPEEYDTLEKAEQHIRDHIDRAIVKENARRDEGGKIKKEVR